MARCSIPYERVDIEELDIISVTLQWFFCESSLVGRYDSIVVKVYLVKVYLVIVPFWRLPCHCSLLMVILWRFPFESSLVVVHLVIVALRVPFVEFPLSSFFVKELTLGAPIESIVIRVSPFRVLSKKKAPL